MPLDFDVVQDSHALPSSVITEHLYPTEFNVISRWRPVQGHHANVSFRVSTVEAGKFQLIWNWFSVVDNQRGRVLLDGRPIPGTIEGVPIAELVPGSAIVLLSPGTHRIELMFSRIRAPTAAGDSRPIPVGLTTLSVRQLEVTTVAPALRAGLLVLALLLVWLLWRWVLTEKGPSLHI